MISRLFTLTLLILGCASVSRADAKECDFVSRADAGEFLSAMPSSVVGWVSCKKTFPQSGVFLVVKAKVHTEADLESTVKMLARTSDARDFTARVAWVSKQPLDKRQIVIETSGDKNETVMSHFAFVGRMDKETSYVFVHSMYDREAHEIHNELDRIHSYVSRAEFLTNLWAAEQSQAVKPVASNRPL